MSIKVSIRQFLQENFVDSLLSRVSELGLKPENIKIELTESILMAHTDSAVRKLKTLGNCGFAIVLDDFGTGYSSLSYLQQFPMDTIKIDRSFISSLEDQEESAGIVKAIISLSKSLGMAVVAEGVENQAQLNLLGALGCDRAQGYLFARPMDNESATSYLHLNGRGCHAKSIFGKDQPYLTCVGLKKGPYPSLWRVAVDLAW